MPFSNGLTPGDEERLHMLMEEAGEIVQAAAKVLRHGYSSRHPDDLTGPDNRVNLGREIEDFEAVVHMLRALGDVPRQSQPGIRAAISRKLRYSHHQQAHRGAFNDET